MRRANLHDFCILVLIVVATAGVAEAQSNWPGFRGPTHDGVAPAVGALDGAAGLVVGWKRALGSGYSSVAVADGRVVALFAEGDGDFAAAFDTGTGNEQWRYRIGDAYKGHDGSHDGPISTPLLAGDRVYGLGAWGHLFALDAATGKAIWTRHLVDELGAKKPHYGFTSSPILVDGVLVVEIGAPEGSAIAGFDPEDGSVLWTAGDDGVDYQSPIATTIGGRLQVLAVGNSKVFGISPRSGEVLWSYEHGGDRRAMGGRTIVPVPAGDGRFFLMTQLESSMMLEVRQGAELDYELSEAWSGKSINRSYVTPVYHDGHLYGISGRVLTCVDAATGEIKWRSREPGDAFLTMVGDKLVAITKAGTLHVAEVSGEGYEELARLDLFDENSWSEVAIADGRLFARSMGHLARVDITSTGGAAQAANAWLAGTAFGEFLAGLNSAEDKQAAIDDYLAAQESFPIVEGSDIVHFVYRGEAEDVGIVGDMIGFRREDPLTRVDGTDLFYYSTRLEPEAAVSYGFIPDYGEPVADPLNPDPADGLFGEVSWLAMPAWREPAFVAEAPVSRQGRLETVTWEHDFVEEVDGEEQTKTETMTAQVYLPVGFDASSDRRYPTVYVHGGKGALEDGAMKHALDNLIGDSVEPVIAVFVMPREGKEDDDTGPMPAYLEMIVGELVPLVDERYPTIQDPRARASIGAADGGSASLVAAIRYPDVFGRVGSQSAILFGMSFGDMLAESETLPSLTIYMDWGTYDLRSPHEAWDMARDNRDAWAALRAAGYRPAGGEVPEGFGWACWRGHTDEMLTALFPLR